MAQMGQKKEEVPVHYTSLSGGERTDEFGNPIMHTEIHQTDEHGNPVYHASQVHQTDQHNKPGAQGRQTEQHAGEPVHYHPSLKDDQGAQRQSGTQGVGFQKVQHSTPGVGTQGGARVHQSGGVGIGQGTPGVGRQGGERVHQSGVGAAHRTPGAVGGQRFHPSQVGEHGTTKENIPYAGTEGGGGQERWDKNETPGSTGAYPTRANVPYAGADVDVGAEQHKKQEQRLGHGTGDQKSTTEKVKEMLPGTRHR